MSVGTVIDIFLRWGGMGIAAGFVYLLLNRRTKEPRYLVQSTNLVADASSRFPALEVRYAGQPVANLTTTRIMFWNAGREPITGRDISSADPLVIQVKEGLTILDHHIANPAGPQQRFTAERSADGRDLKLGFDHLNQNEGAVVQMLHTGLSPTDVEITGRIAGARRIQRLSLPQTPVREGVAYLRLITVAITLVCGTMFFSLLLFPGWFRQTTAPTPPPPRGFLTVPQAELLMLGVIALFWLLYWINWRQAKNPLWDSFYERES